MTAYFWIRRLSDNAIVIAERFTLGDFQQYACTGSAQALRSDEVEVIRPVERQ